MLFRSAEEDKALAERSQKKAVDNLRSVIKHLEPPVNNDDSFESIKPRLESYKEYQILDDEARQIGFSKYIRRLQEKAEDAERERARRESRRDRDRSVHRDRDYRRSYDYDDRRDRGSGRHRTRTPEIDAYEADRRKAQADRERSYRKASFGLTPPPRDRRDGDRYVSDRDRDREPPRERRSDRYESMYERERREREMERERNYASRADPRDRGKSAMLDYGDEDAVGSRPGSVRKRRESDASMSSRRDNKVSSVSIAIPFLQHNPPEQSEHALTLISSAPAAAKSPTPTPWLSTRKK